MRLTNVARMALPEGRVRSLDLRVGPDRGPAVPVSFDQGRHVALGQRPGSWMAVCFRPPGPVTDAHLETAWLAVVERHGTLRTAFTLSPAGEVGLHEIDLFPGEWVEHEVGADGHPREVVRQVFDAACAPLGSPSHRLCVVQPDEESSDARPAVLVGLDHAHVDLWSLLVIARDLSTCLADVENGRPPGATLPATTSFAEHTAALAAMPSAPEHVHRRWAEILDAGGGVMPTFPLPLGDLSTAPPEVVELRDVLDAEELERFSAHARAQGVRMISMATSVMTGVFSEAAGEPLRAILPVHSRHEERWHDSVGWFITNAVMEAQDPDPAACARAVAEAIDLGSHALGPIMEPYGGMPASPAMFAVSWLDGRRVPVPVAPELEVQHVSAVTRTDGVMIWFLVNASGLHLRCRYPDTGQARRSVGGWLDALQDGLRACLD